MASITHNKRTGERRITYYINGERQKPIHCGSASKADAQYLKRQVEELVTAKAYGRSPTADVAGWLVSVGDDVYKKLVSAGLVEPRGGEAVAVAVQTVAAFIDGYLVQRADVKASTLTAMRQSRIWLCRYLGESRKLDEVTNADADGYKAHMIREKLAKATINKRIRYARHFFDIAKRRKLVTDNPFGHLKGAVVGNPARREFVPAETINRIIEQVPCPQWKLLIALARFGGLRIPSEALALKWGDVDFSGKRFIVRSSKTEHHDDGGVRIVPMFPELVDRFQVVFDAAAEGEEHVITRYRDATQNIRTQFERWIIAAGVKPWPKLWQNLRASRATELADVYPSHVCAGWLGHTEKIADSFYRMTTDAHFDAATTTTTTTVTTATTTATTTTPAPTVQNPARNPARCIAELSVTERNGESDSVSTDHAESLENTANAVILGDSSATTQNAKVGDGGLEPSTSRV